MPRLKPCQHHLHHVNSVDLPKGRRPVSSQLLKFMRQRDGKQNLDVRWLCPNCLTFETKEWRQMEIQLGNSEKTEHTESDEYGTDDENDEENFSSQSNDITSSSSQESSSSDENLY